MEIDSLIKNIKELQDLLKDEKNKFVDEYEGSHLQKIYQRIDEISSELEKLYKKLEGKISKEMCDKMDVGAALDIVYNEKKAVDYCVKHMRADLLSINKVPFKMAAFEGDISGDVVSFHIVPIIDLPTNNRRFEILRKLDYLAKRNKRRGI